MACGCDVLIMADGSGDDTVWHGCPDRQSQSSPVINCWVAGSIANVPEVSSLSVIKLFWKGG